LNKTKDGVKLRGFFRLQISEDDRIVGDSGWKENTTTNIGIRDYLVDHIIGSSEAAVQYAALGTGGTPASNTTQLPGELAHATDNNRLLITGGTSIISSRTAQFVGTFASTDSHVTVAADISNIGLYSEQSDTGTDLFAGNTYASSTLNTNQNVNFTYQIRFASA